MGPPAAEPSYLDLDIIRSISRRGRLLMTRAAGSGGDRVRASAFPGYFAVVCRVTASTGSAEMKLNSGLVIPGRGGGKKSSWVQRSGNAGGVCRALGRQYKYSQNEMTTALTLTALALSFVDPTYATGRK